MAVEDSIRIPAHQRLGHGSGASSQPQYGSGVCIFWLQGRCNRHPCRFLHEKPSPTVPFTGKSLVWVNNRNGAGYGCGGGSRKKVNCEVTGRLAVRGSGDALGVAEEVHVSKTRQCEKGNTSTAGSPSVGGVADVQVTSAPQVATEVLNPCSFFCRSTDCHLGDAGGGGGFSMIAALEGPVWVNPKMSGAGYDQERGQCEKAKCEVTRSPIVHGRIDTVGIAQEVHAPNSGHHDTGNPNSDWVNEGGGPCKKVKCEVTGRPATCGSDDAVGVAEEVPAPRSGQLEKENTNTRLSPIVSGWDVNVAVAQEASAPQVATEVLKPCSFYSEGMNCHLGDGGGGGFSMIVELGGHQKPIKGIALPPGSNKLISASSDGSVKMWDCQSSLCIEPLNLGCEISCLIGDEGWVFVGIPGAIKAWSSQTGVKLSLDIPGGRQAYSLVVGNVNGTYFLFAGFQDGSILVWTWNPIGNCFEPAAGYVIASFTGAHSLAVVTLVVGKEFLYSGSLDSTIKVWELETLKCVQTLTSHGGPVTSILCWYEFMLSGSLDGTVKVWRPNLESGPLELTYTHKEEHGVVALGAMLDAEYKPVLFCSCDNNIAHLYHLPSFMKKGWIFFNAEARHMQTGPEGLFFTGDGAGQLKVWKWN